MDQFEDEHMYGLVDPPFDSENRPPEPSPPHTHTPHPTAPHPIAPEPSSTGAADETPVADDIQTEYHRHSSQRTETRHFEDYGRAEHDLESRFHAHTNPSP